MRVVINHGTKGSPDAHWFPWLAEQAEAAGARAFRPAYPTPEGQSLTFWKETFYDECGQVDSETILVGHSVGAVLALRLLETAKTPAAGTFLAGCLHEAIGNPEYDKLNASFIKPEFDWEKIKRNTGVLKIYHGDNDPYVPLEQAQYIAQRLGTELIVVPGGGHFQDSAGFTKFEQLWQDLKSLLDQKPPHCR